MPSCLRLREAIETAKIEKETVIEKRRNPGDTDGNIRESHGRRYAEYLSNQQKSANAAWFTATGTGESRNRADSCTGW